VVAQVIAQPTSEDGRVTFCFHSWSNWWESRCALRRFKQKDVMI
jgi:hypothetical protein